MKRHVKTCLAIIACASLMAHAGVAQADQLASIKAKGSMVCGVLDIFEPFGYIDPTTRSTVGYDIDFCHALGQQLGVSVQVRPLSIEARIPALQQGHVDILAAGLAYTEQRAQQVDYSHVYYVSENVLAVTTRRGYKEVGELAGKRISVVKGSISENYLDEVLPTAKAIGYDDVTTAFTALSQGRVEATTTSEEVVRQFLHKLGEKESANYLIIYPAIGREVWGLGVRKNEPTMLTAVNEALEKMEQAGAVQTIFDKWLGAQTTYQMQRPFKIEPIKN